MAVCTTEPAPRVRSTSDVRKALLGALGLVVVIGGAVGFTQISAGPEPVQLRPDDPVEVALGAQVYEAQCAA